MNIRSTFEPFLRHTRYCFGGEGGGTAAAVPAVTPATPPVSPDASAVVDVQQNLIRQQLRRKSLSSTIYAGATGGWTPTIPSGTTGATAPSVSGGPTKTG
jgi:hypothetical protein